MENIVDLMKFLEVIIIMENKMEKMLIGVLEGLLFQDLKIKD